MSKVHGPKECFVPVRRDATQTIISYEKVADGKKNAYWQEVVFYKKKNGSPTLEQVKQAVFADINRQTDEKILTGMVWTPEGGEPVNVWLSTENQFNFSEADRKAEKNPGILPLTFKIGEKDGEPFYHTFETYEELDAFYMQAFAFINQCLTEGWARKDGIDWAPYEEALNPEDVEQ